MTMKSTPLRQAPVVERPNDRRVVITGMSAITPMGNSVRETWEGLVAGRSGLGPITLLDPSPYPCRIAGQISGFEVEAYIPHKKARQMATATQLAVVAAGQAADDACLDLENVDRDRIGVVIGTAGGSSIEETERAAKHLMQTNSGRLLPSQMMRIFANMASYFVAQTYNLRGSNLTVCTACASGAQAIGEAAHVILRGEAEVMLAGGTESVISDSAMAGFTAMRALATSYNDEPHRAMRPFDRDREGFVPALGCAMLVLERLDHALARGARPYAELLGSGVSNDAFHVIAPSTNGSGAALAIRRALANAGLDPADIDYINAHGTSTPLGDTAETRAIKSVFGEGAYDIPVSSSKSMLGHLMGAAGAVEAVASVMTLQEGIIHPTINYETPDPECDLDYVPNEAREAPVRTVLSNSFGLGGQNACLVLGKLED